MSATVPPGTPAKSTKIIELQTWGAIVVSTFVMVLFLAALVIAFLAKDQGQLGLLVGGILTMSSIIVGFWCGSSSGSQKKDDALAAVAAAPPPATTTTTSTLVPPTTTTTTSAPAHQ